MDYYAKPYKCGRPKYVDQNHDGILDNQDLTYLGNADPVVYGGLQNNFHIYGFDLGIFLAYSVGGSIYNYSEFFMAGTYCSNQYRYMLNSWHPYRNPDSNFPAAGASGSSMLPSDFLVHDASYLRLKSVKLSYKFEVDAQHHRGRQRREPLRLDPVQRLRPGCVVQGGGSGIYYQKGRYRRIPASTQDHRHGSNQILRAYEKDSIIVCKHPGP